MAASVILLMLAVHPTSAAANDTMATAQGPITSGVEAAIETENDVDWFYFYALGSTQVDVALTGLDENCFRWYAQLKDSNGDELSSTSARSNQIDHIRYTVSLPGTYYVEIWAGLCGDVGRYRFTISGSPPLLTGPPPAPPPPPPPTVTPRPPRPPRAVDPGPSQGCLRARSQATRLSQRINRLGSPRQRARIRSKLRRARARARSLC